MEKVSPTQDPKKKVTATERGHLLKQYFPIFSWLPSYNWGLLRPDLLASLTVCAVVVPECVAYAQLAGVPPQAALFAAPFLLLGYAIFGSSRQVVVGATSVCSVMLAVTVVPLARNNPEKYFVLMVGLSLIVGVMFLLLGIARLGFVKNFLAKPVVIGFVFGLALVIVISQVTKLLGLTHIQGNFFERAWEIIIHLGSTNGWSLLVGIVSLALLFGLERFAPRVPASVAAVVFGILIVSVLNLEQQGVAIVGTIPGAFPRPGIPRLGFDDIASLLPGALGIVLVIYAEHISATQEMAIKYHYDIDANQELIALGVANLGAGLFQGFAGGGSLSKTTVNDVSGARSQMSGIAAAVLVLIITAVLTPLFHNLPDATLGAIVIHAVWRLMNIGELRRYFRVSKPDFVLAATALLGVLIFEILPGLLIAVILSLLLLIFKVSRPHIAVLGKAPGKQNEYTDIERHPENETVPGLLIVRLDAPLFFANDMLLRNRIHKLVRTTTPRPRTVLIDMEATNDLGISSTDMLAELATELKTEGVALELARARDPLQDMLQRTGVTGAIGKEHIYRTIDEGVEDFTGEKVAGEL